jgi:peptidoglycan glycosyltransferase
MACLVLIAALLVNVCYVQVVEAKRLRDDPRNFRLLLDQYSRQRGAIVAGGTAIARSVATSDTLKYLRVYPQGAMWAHVTGYYSLTLGRADVEQSQNEWLAGSADRLFATRLNDMITGRQPQGANVVLTLDPTVQAAAVHALGNRIGAVVAMDPKTGAILGLVSSPSFDPNPLSSHDTATISNAWRGYQSDPNHPLLDRATQETYPPGSLFKVVTSAAALATGKYTPSSQIPAPNALPLPQTSSVLRNFGGESCGNGSTTSLADALRISCNTAFADLGLALGEPTLRAMADAFGLDAPPPDIALPAARSSFGNPDAPGLAKSAIGQQDVRITPLQAAMIVSTVANGGVLMRPYLVSEVQAADLSVLSHTDPHSVRRVMSADVARELTSMMELVVTSGTGTAARIPGVAVAGKTGTAQNAPGQAPHAWFGAFAPAENPRIAVAVIVEHGGGSLEATGGTVAAPIARAVIEAFLGKGTP